MSVFTNVTLDEAQQICTDFGLSHANRLSPILHGTQNSNYWLTSPEGEFVLTIVEELEEPALNAIYHFSSYLNQKGIPCPVPLKKKNNSITHAFHRKPMLILKKLIGMPVDPPLAQHVEKVGEMLGALHVLSAAYTGEKLADSRGKDWRQSTHKQLKPFLIETEASYSNQAQALDDAIDWPNLPSGMIHADLFTDNILWHGSQISGVIDFYFACEGAYVYDLAVVFNDWCFNALGEFKSENAEALLKGYIAKRIFSANETLVWRSICSVAALRFWLSRRLVFQYSPISGDVMQKDPNPFLKIMQFHLEGGFDLPRSETHT